MADRSRTGRRGRGRRPARPTRRTRSGTRASTCWPRRAWSALLELAAIRAVEAQLPAGAGTVGTHVHVRHLAATPVGMRATIRATLREVDGRRFVFDIERHDEVERIVEERTSRSRSIRRASSPASPRRSSRPRRIRPPPRRGWRR